jgi:hypothetical protein
MTRKLLFFIAPVLAALFLLVGPALAPARASAPKPVVKTNVAAPFFCMGGLPLRGSGALCLHF